ncbi:MAG: DNA-3-methyladenine glycosylase I [Nitratireductor sp.]
MRKFDEILAIAVERHGGLDRVEARIPTVATRTELEARPADRWLSEMTRHVFNAGFSRKVIREKWPEFETAFYGFDPRRCAAMSDAWLDELMKDTRIVRNGARIQSVQRNAVFVLDEVERHGSFGAFLASWKPADFTKLLIYLQRNGDRLGDKTAQYYLRETGVDAFVLSFDVLKRLSLEGVTDKLPTSHTQREVIQRAFDTWAAQSGKSLTYISRVLAMSVESDRVPRTG